MRLALLGKPGAGKGTQGVRLAERLGLPLVSVGDLLRREARAGGDRDLADLLARGELVPDEAIVAIVNEALAASTGSGGYVLDGFPRTLTQADDEDAPRFDAVVHVDVPDDVARRRVAGRADDGRADDARRDTIDRRLRAFHTDTVPVLDRYRRHGILTTVDGTRPREQVTESIIRAIQPQVAVADLRPSPGT